MPTFSQAYPADELGALEHAILGDIAAIDDVDDFLTGDEALLCPSQDFREDAY